MTDFAFETTVPIRYQDLDTMGHVNNAVYATYFEEARVSYLQDGLEIPLAKINCVLAHLELDFAEPITADGTSDRAVTVGVATVHVGTTSLTMAYEIRDDDRVYATGETTLVVLDPETGAPTEPDESWIEDIQRVEGRVPERTSR